MPRTTVSMSRIDADGVLIEYALRRAYRRSSGVVMAWVLIVQFSLLMASADAGPFESGVDAFERGDYEAAITHFEAVLDAAPDDVNARLHLAQACQKAGKNTKAHRLYVRILNDYPRHPAASLALADIYTRRERFERVVELLEPFYNPSASYELTHLLAGAYLHTDRLDKAEPLFRAIIERHPTAAVDRFELATIYQKQNRHALATSQFRKALDLGCDVEPIYLLYAKSLFALERYVEPVAQVTLGDASPGDLCPQGYVLGPSDGDSDSYHVAAIDSVVTQLAEARRWGTDTLEVGMMLARALNAARRYRSALIELERVKAKFTFDDPAQEARFVEEYAAAALGEGQVRTFLVRMKRAARLDPKRYRPKLLDAYRTAADHYNQLGDLDNYIACLNRAADEAPESAELHFLLGNANWERGDAQAAVRQWKLTLQLEPDHPQRDLMLEMIRQATSE